MRITAIKVGDKVDFCNPKTGLWKYLGVVSKIETEDAFLGTKNVYQVKTEKGISEFWYAPEQLRASQ